MNVPGVWAQPGAPAGAGAGVAAAVDELAAWLGATEIRLGKRLPRSWAGALRSL